MSDTLKFEIKQSMGIISEKTNGWKKELNLVSWNDHEPKYDIREWDSEHQKMKKGITLTKEELLSLKSLLNDIA